MIKKKRVRQKKETILVFGAHTDDFVIGAGGTIANYVQEGKKVISLVFSYGELSHPWMKGKVVQDFRSQEALEAGKILNCKTIFFGLRENHFPEDYQEKNIEKEILKIIEREKPSKIFTHSIEDPHPDHKAVNNITIELFEEITFKPKPELYVYSIWNPVSFKTRWPAFYVNVTKNFSLKMKALKSFKSQKIHVAYPLFLLIFREIKNGLKISTFFAEMFYRVK